MRKLTSALIAVSVFMSLIIQIHAASFTDVPNNTYYSAAVQWAIDHGITNGMGDGTFGVNRTVTRAQAVTFLWRAAGEPAPITKFNPFTDVSPDHYAKEAILWAVENNITEGMGNNLFSPDGPVTRGQMITFLWRAKGRPGGDTGGKWYEGAERWANQKGILSGTAQKYSTDANCPRQDVVYYLYLEMSSTGANEDTAIADDNTGGGNNHPDSASGGSASDDKHADDGGAGYDNNGSNGNSGSNDNSGAGNSDSSGAGNSDNSGSSDNSGAGSNGNGGSSGVTGDNSGSAPESIRNGTCGTLTWTLDENGMLTISGSGDIESHSGASKCWYGDYHNDVTDVVIGEGVTGLGGNAFANCGKLKSVTIPGSIKKFGGSAFSGCGSLTRVTIGTGVETIGDYAFWKCGSLEEVNIPAGVTRIGTFAFYGCNALKSVTIPNSVTRIGQSAFEGCGGLTSVNIPASVTAIVTNAFANCPNLTRVTYGGTRANWSGKFSNVGLSNGCTVTCTGGGTDEVYIVGG